VAVFGKSSLFHASRLTRTMCLVLILASSFMHCLGLSGIMCLDLLKIEMPRHVPGLAIKLSLEYCLAMTKPCSHHWL